MEYPLVLSDIVMRSRIFSYIMQTLPVTVKWPVTRTTEEKRQPRKWFMWEHYKLNAFVSDYHTTHMQETAYSLSLFQTMVPLGLQ